MSTHDVADDSLEDCLFGLDIGGDKWAQERNADTFDAAGIKTQGSLLRPLGANLYQARGHIIIRRCKHLFGYLYKHPANEKLQEMIFMQAMGDGRSAFLLLGTVCKREMTPIDLEELKLQFYIAIFFGYSSSLAT